MGQAGDRGQPVHGVGDALLARIAIDDMAAVALVRTDWTIAYANPSFRTHGYEPDDLVGRDALQFLHPEDLTRALVSGELLSSRAAYGTAPFRFLRADGEYVTLDVASVFIEADGADYYAFVLRENPFDRARIAAYSAMVSGDPPEQSLRGLTAGFSPSRPETLIAFDATNHRRVIGPLPPALVGVFGGRQDRAPGTPWGQALDKLEAVAVTTPDALPEPVRLAAEAKGLRVAAFLGLADPGRPQPALLAAWSPDPAVRDILALNLRDIEALVRLALDRRTIHERLEHLAHHDPLTSLPNRVSFFTQLDAATAQHGPVAVAYLDLDGFKEVNDEHGHAAGDDVLVELSGRFGREMRSGDLVARLGGDEFGVLIMGPPSTDAAVAITERLLAVAREPIDIGGVQVQLAASAGLVMVDDAAVSSPDAVVRRADTALYRAKAKGPGSLKLAENRNSTT